MKYPAFLYSFKIWLTSACLAPVPFLLKEALNVKDGDYYFLDTYPLLASMGLIFSGLQWLVFWSMAELIVKIFPNNLLRKLLISVTGICLALTSFYLFFRFWSLPLTDRSLLQAVIAGTACVALGSWYFKIPLATNHLSKDNSYEKEIQ